VLSAETSPGVLTRSEHPIVQRADTPLVIPQYLVALQNATMAIGRSRRPRGPTYARGTNRSLFEDPELADNARHLATRRAHPAFKFFTSLIPEAESFICRVNCASHHAGAGRTHVTPANVRLRWPHASRLASCNLSFRTPLSLSLLLFSAIGDRTAMLGPFSSLVTCRKVISFFSTPSFFLSLFF
jgi:hypothetical protein